MALSDVEFAKRLCAACGGAKWRQDDVFGAEPRPTDATSDRQQRGRRAVAWPGFTFPAYVGGADGDAVDLLSDGDEDEAQNGGAAATDGSGGVVAIGDCGRSAGNDYDDAVLLVDEQGAPGFVVDAGTAVVGSNPASPIIHSSLRDGGGSDSIMTDDVTSSVSNASKPHKQRISRDITTITTTSSSTSITDTDAPKFPREIEAMKQELLTEIRAASSQKLTEDNTDEGGAPSVVDNEAALLRVGIASQNLFASIHEPELLRRVLAADDFRSSAAVDSASVSDLVVLKLCMGFVQSSPSACCMEKISRGICESCSLVCHSGFTSAMVNSVFVPLLTNPCFSEQHSTLILKLVRKQPGEALPSLQQQQVHQMVIAVLHALSLSEVPISKLHASLLRTLSMGGELLCDSVLVTHLCKCAQWCYQAEGANACNPNDWCSLLLMVLNKKTPPTLDNDTCALVNSVINTKWCTTSYLNQAVKKRITEMN